MDDETALLALANSNPAEVLRARSALAERYYGPLVMVLKSFVAGREDIAYVAAADALNRLFVKVALDLSTVDPANDGVKRWLVKVGKNAATDELRRVRRENQKFLTGFYSPESGAEDPAAVFDRPDPRSAPADELAAARDLARRLVQFIFGLDQPGRGILLFDLVEPYEQLTGEQLDVHDQELVDYSLGYKTLTQAALRGHRNRARAAVEAFLEREGR